MDYRSIATFAVELAEKAGRHIAAARAAEGLTIGHKRGVELLTSADVEADELICGGIAAAFPDHRILSEESFPDLVAAHGRGPLWVVDPIDGTVNYAYGHSQVAVSIALALDGVTQVGVVHAPFQAETFTAVRGAGARLNGAAIDPADCTELHRALVGTGFPYERGEREALLPRLNRVLLHCRDMRRIGSAAIDLCWVAAGRLDAFYETLSPWDIAAGRLVAAEAGARLTNLGDPADVCSVDGAISPDLNGRELVAATPGIFAALVALLEDD